MISEESCEETEDWSNDNENFTLHHQKKNIILHVKIEKVILNWINIMMFFFFN